MNTDESRKQFEQTLEFVSEYNFMFYKNVTQHLDSFIQDGFLKNLFEKNTSKSVDKAQLLIEKFGDAANPANFTSQAQATNIHPTTLSLIFSIALYISFRSWETFATKYYMTFGDMGDVAYDEGVTDDGLDGSSENEPDKDEDDLILGLQLPNPVVNTPPILPDVEITSADQTVIPKNSWKKDKQKARITVDKQVKNQQILVQKH
ncbi:hypothetical protein RhiirA5_431440 [Rhizophagus irregularis]|uniref:Uncharacterized protein n=2 Tax=Rhizophagus irregularis TaxID=588596 RepID=A0A2N0NV08_9GLOM|nr:hypothetical protein RirG_120330 [Rhizophagus irregularis DAOM 197198w]PKB98397.1 hypothetical protein RhiirA5_431440 [Rhizophagus irregularis]